MDYRRVNAGLSLEFSPFNAPVASSSDLDSRDPFLSIAIGALFDNTRRGALVGLIFVGVLIALTIAVII
jgi:hypothetical protein